jgi:tRNA(Arg) A34 adenosine deaminase TadA
MMKSFNPNLNYYLQKNVEELIKPEVYAINEGMKERHRLYGLLLMAITKYYWNGNKEGRNGDYPLNPKKYGEFEFSDYLGHNIASIAVDAYGSVIDFEFNHNKLFNSSAEHAESRMVKRVYALTQINDSWKTTLEPHNPRTDYNTFEDVTLYTTLESCSQCAGIMALARVKEIVYLQTDPGMYLIGNILRNLTRKIDGIDKSSGTLTSPMPISGKDIDFKYFNKLDEAYGEFPELLKSKAFFKPNDINQKEKRSDSITSFLCTEAAYNIYSSAFTDFENLSEDLLQYPDFKPLHDGKELENARMNKFVLAEIKDFYQYAVKSGKRATPHK